jgi:hypothetical protein
VDPVLSPEKRLEAARTTLRFKARTLVEVFRSPTVPSIEPTLDPALQELDAVVEAAVRRELVAPQSALLGSRAAAPEPTGLFEALAARRERLRQLWLEQGVQLSSLEFIDLEDVQAALGTDECILDLVWHEVGVATIVIWRTDVDAHALTVDEARALLDVGRSGKGPDRLALICGLTGKLSDRVLACSRIFAVPDRALSAVNLTLPLGYGPEVAVLPGAALLPALRGTRRATGSGVLIIGSDPRGDLPGVKYEVEQLRTIVSLAGKRLRVAGTGDANALDHLAEASDEAILHFACHGWLAPSRDDSGLLIERDGSPFLLTVDDVERHVRVTASLVVLSACEVGQHTSIQDDLDALGIPRAYFARSRARCIVASMSRVDDAMSSLVMSEFYRRLFGGMAVGQALREAEAQVASLTRSKLYVLAEDGWPVNESLLARGDAGDLYPYRNALEESPYVIYGDPSFSLVMEDSR